ncbi:hypothetical protein NHX12_000102 [Muraenolepis orangiensis]|uniref:Uncharacterized protein n=1 Tax=Muraenolepis orangiensis TaxID=630683 RepID=A0A9Q0D8D5_9TELE|nr:hypothetical protein NHX12_000102 [Muraenolepis orangiensis]
MGLPQVSEEANSQLEGPLTIRSYRLALQGMQGRRAPGIDGLSVEFYKAYWDVLSHDLLERFLMRSLASWLYASGPAGERDHTAPKKGYTAGHQELASCVPLLCVDYKILSKALATRLWGQGCGAGHPNRYRPTVCPAVHGGNVHLIRDVWSLPAHWAINLSDFSRSEKALTALSTAMPLEMDQKDTDILVDTS